jgi:hypothetical protein
MAMSSFLPPLVRALAVLAVLADVVHGFYLPGVAPKSFHPGEDVELKVNKLRY